MTIDKAIEVLQVKYDTANHTEEPDFYDALRLGTYALWRIKAGRDKGYDYFGHRLPGETED